jgi:serine/threonine protein kinase
MSANLSQKLMKGIHIGEYLLIEKIGKGGSAEVWHVQNSKGESFAIKIFCPENSSIDFGLDFLKQEFAKTIDLNHPNILRPIKYDNYQARPYLVMELCEGSVMNLLKMKIYENNKITGGLSKVYFDEESLSLIMADISSALEYLHEKGFIHQDLKPDNILYKLDTNGRYKYFLSDFGVSSRIKKTILQETTMLAKQKTGLSPDYASPEAFKGEVKSNSDIFSLGVTIYELATGNTPSKSNTISTGQMVTNGGVIADLPSAFSVRFNSLIKAMLRIRPENRPNANEIVKMVENYLSDGFWPSVAISKKSKVKYLIGILSILILGSLIFFAIQFISFEDNTISLVEDFEIHKAAMNVSINDPMYKEIINLDKKFIEFKPTLDNKYAIAKTQNGKYGIINDKAKLLINAEYDMIYPFEDINLILVEKGKKCGYINIYNNVIIPINKQNCVNYKSTSGKSIEQFIKELKR